LATDSSSYQTIADIFGLCTVPTSPAEIESLIGTLNGSLGTMAMVDYPYPTDFTANLPAWPVNVACADAVSEATANADSEFMNLYAISAAGSVYYNYAADPQFCLDVTVSQDQGLDDSGWSVQACNEMVMPFASGDNSMFPKSEWNETRNTAYC
jgi:lysosomal Pro-X carboxypeptidase